jgi:hypothetical protein
MGHTCLPGASGHLVHAFGFKGGRIFLRVSGEPLGLLLSGMGSGR